MLKVIYHLHAEFVLRRWSTLFFLALFYRFLAHCTLFSHARVCMTEPCKLDTITDWIPFEIEHRVDGLNFDPPASLLKGISDQT